VRRCIGNKQAAHRMPHEDDLNAPRPAPFPGIVLELDDLCCKPFDKVFRSGTLRGAVSSLLWRSRCG
jgi:hypothetical protein